MYIKDKKNSLYAEILFRADKKSGLKNFFGMGNSNKETRRPDYFEGCIMNKDNIDYKKNKSKLEKSKNYISFVNGFWQEEV